MATRVCSGKDATIGLGKVTTVGPIGLKVYAWGQKASWSLVGSIAETYLCQSGCRKGCDIFFLNPGTEDPPHHPCRGKVWLEGQVWFEGAKYGLEVQSLV